MRPRELDALRMIVALREAERFGEFFPRRRGATFPLVAKRQVQKRAAAGKVAPRRRGKNSPKRSASRSATIMRSASSSRGRTLRNSSSCSRDSTFRCRVRRTFRISRSSETAPERRVARARARVAQCRQNPRELDALRMIVALREASASVNSSHAVAVRQHPFVAKRQVQKRAAAGLPIVRFLPACGKPAAPAPGPEEPAPL